MDLGTVPDWIQVLAVALGLLYTYRSVQAARHSVDMSRVALDESIAQSKRVALFEHLRTIEERQVRTWAGKGIRHVIENEAKPIAGQAYSDDFCAWIALFNAIDLLAFAIARGEVEKSAAEKFLTDFSDYAPWLEQLSQKLTELHDGNQNHWRHAREFLSTLRGPDVKPQKALGQKQDAPPTEPATSAATQTPNAGSTAT